VHSKPNSGRAHLAPRALHTPNHPERQHAEMLERATDGFDIDVNSADEFTGDTALHSVLQEPGAPARIVAALMASGADVTLKNAAGHTPLALAFKATESQALALIERMDAALVDGKLPNGKTLLDAAQAANAPALLAALVARGADVSKAGTKLATQAIEAKDDWFLGALIPKVKSSTLDTLGLSYRHLVADGFPRAAAQLLKRTSDDPGAARHSHRRRRRFAHGARRVTHCDALPLKSCIGPLDRHVTA
jgi:hypothetical protein